MYTIEKKTLTDIADAIREKTEELSLYTPEEMAVKIRNLSNASPDENKIVSQDKLTDLYSHISSATTRHNDDRSACAISAITCFQYDGSQILYDSGHQKYYFHVSRDNNKAIVLEKVIPKNATKLCITMRADGGSESYPFQRYKLIKDFNRITGYYNNQIDGTILKDVAITDGSSSISALESQDGVKMVATSNRVVPFQTIEIDVSEYDTDLHFAIWACRSYIDIYEIWYE